MGSFPVGSIHALPRHPPCVPQPREVLPAGGAGIEWDLSLSQVLRLRFPFSWPGPEASLTEPGARALSELRACSIKQFRELTACHELQQTRSQPGMAGFAPRQKNLGKQRNKEE